MKHAGMLLLSIPGLYCLATVLGCLIVAQLEVGRPMTLLPDRHTFDLVLLLGSCGASLFAIISARFAPADRLRAAVYLVNTAWLACALLVFGGHYLSVGRHPFRMDPTQVWVSHPPVR